MIEGDCGWVHLNKASIRGITKTTTYSHEEKTRITYSPKYLMPLSELPSSTKRQTSHKTNMREKQKLINKLY